jgi:uncharacterized protein YdeI (YjbR/CyaY-like superfamily)
VTVKKELDQLLVPDAGAWHDWLTTHHETSPGVWLAVGKKGGGVTDLTRADALDEALCFGWIDGQARTRDEGSYWQRMTPRGPRSRWSLINVGHVERLEQAGRMRSAGRAAVDAAKADGRWDSAYAGPATAQVPDDLAAAIAADPRAQAMFDVLTSSNRFTLIHRLGAVKREETRARKIEEFVAMLAREETPYPQKARPEPQEER